MGGPGWERPDRTTCTDRTTRGSGRAPYGEKSSTDLRMTRVQRALEVGLMSFDYIGVGPLSPLRVPRWNAAARHPAIRIALTNTNHIKPYVATAAPIPVDATTIPR